MNANLAVGLTALAGAALVETALIPGRVIGGEAVLGRQCCATCALAPRGKRGGRIGQASPRLQAL